MHFRIDIFILTANILTSYFFIAVMSDGHFIFRIILQALFRKRGKQQKHNLTASFCSPSSGDRPRQTLRGPCARHLLSAAHFRCYTRPLFVGLFLLRPTRFRDCRPSSICRFSEVLSSECARKNKTCQEFHKANVTMRLRDSYSDS